MHEAAFEEKASSKAYEAIRNRARNEFKHLCDGEDFNVNLEREASQMIRRAIENFKALNPGYYPRFKEFANVWLERNQ